MKDEPPRELGAWKPLSRCEAEGLLDVHSVDLPVEEVEEDPGRVLHVEHTSIFTDLFSCRSRCL